MSLSEKEKATIRQNNGRIIIEALDSLKNPQTLRNVVKHIALNNEVEDEDVKIPVQRTLDKGVHYGFIEKNGTRYGIPRNIQPEELATTHGRRGSMSSYASKTRSKSRARSRSKPRKSMRGRSRTTSRSKSKTKSRGRSTSARSSSRAKQQKTTARKGRGSSRGRK